VKTKKLNSLLFALFIYLISLGQSLFAQEMCGAPETSVDPAMMALINETGRNGGNFELRLYFHVIKNNHCEGGISRSTIEEGFNNLEETFRNTDISFYWDRCIDEICDDFFSENPTTDEIFNVNRNTDGIDVYVYDNNETNYFGKAAGIGNNAALLLCGYPKTGLHAILTNIFAHEIGHVLNLHHTHRGCNVNEAGYELEHPNSSNCLTAGDYICDTPADFNLYDRVNDDCTFKQNWWQAEYCTGMPLSPLYYKPNKELIMSYTAVPCLKKFTLGQIEHMKGSIQLNPSLQAVVYNNSGTPFSFCSKATKCNTIYTEDAIITSDFATQGDIIIKNGAHVTIQATISLSENSNIIVERGAKLTLDGAYLTTCPNVPYWQGIKIIGHNRKAQGYPSASITDPQGACLTVINNSLIENAIIAIDADPYFDIYSSRPDHYSGGLITIQNASIQNCKTGIKMGKYGLPKPLLNVYNENSTIQNLTLLGCDTGIKLRLNKGLSIIESQFEINNYGTGIYCNSSTMTFDNNSIEGGDYGIRYLALYPVLGENSIINNDFVNIRTGLEWDSHGSGMHFEVANNNFVCEFAINPTGSSQYLIINNEFLNAHSAVYSKDTGKKHNQYVHSNRVSNTNYGLTADGQNDGVYLQNCFDNLTNYNLALTDYSSIFTEQGDPEIPAANCFDQQVTSIVTGQNSEIFNYYVYESEDTLSCYYPNTPGNFTIARSGDPNPESSCGNGLYVHLDPRFRKCVIPESIREKLNMQTQLNLEINRIKNDPSLSPSLKKYLLAKYYRCLYLLVPSITRQYLTMPDSTNKLIAYLLEQEEEDHKIMGYGILKDMEEYELANQLLSTLQENNPTSYSLTHSQECLNQRGLPNVNENSQFTTLLTLAHQNNSSAGFARGVYEYLTGISINIDRPFPTLLFPRSVNRNKKIDEVTVFPNPTGRKNITISLPDFDGGDLYNAEITDVLNKGLFSQSLNQQSTQVDISSMPESILIVTIYKNNLPVQRIKLLNL